MHAKFHQQRNIHIIYIIIIIIIISLICWMHVYFYLIYIIPKTFAPGISYGNIFFLDFIFHLVINAVQNICKESKFRNCKITCKEKQSRKERESMVQGIHHGWTKFISTEADHVLNLIGEQYSFLLYIYIFLKNWWIHSYTYYNLVILKL